MKATSGYCFKGTFCSLPQSPCHFFSPVMIHLAQWRVCLQNLANSRLDRPSGPTKNPGLISSSGSHLFLNYFLSSSLRVQSHFSFLVPAPFLFLTASRWFTSPYFPPLSSWGFNWGASFSLLVFAAPIPRLSSYWLRTCTVAVKTMLSDSRARLEQTMWILPRERKTKHLFIHGNDEAIYSNQFLFNHLNRLLECKCRAQLFIMFHWWAGAHTLPPNQPHWLSKGFLWLISVSPLILSDY